jgi:hypothetical protein
VQDAGAQDENRDRAEKRGKIITEPVFFLFARKIVNFENESFYEI